MTNITGGSVTPFTQTLPLTVTPTLEETDAFRCIRQTKHQVQISGHD